MKLNEVDRSKLSPMMLQWAEIKDKYKDELIFFRLGDFYELFFEDATLASHELELTLTGKVAGLSSRVPMCGIPYHSVKSYLEKLVNKGYKVAIAEQLEDAKNTKGMVKRGVVSVVSKGTIADFELLDEHSESFIGSAILFSDMYLLTYVDISTGNLKNIKLNPLDEVLINEIISLNIKEIILLNNENISLIDILKNKYFIDVIFSSDLLDYDIPQFLCEIDSRSSMGVKHLFYYLKEKLLKDLNHINEIEEKNKLEFLEMDIHSIRNLELVETLRLKERQYSLIWLIDKTKTALGSRKLKNWLLNPLKDEKALNKRYDMIEKLNTEFILKDNLRILLYEVYDLERLVGKTMNGSLNARDLLQFKYSLKVLPDIKEIIEKLGFNYDFSLHLNVYNILEMAIREDPPITLKEGYIIKDGYNEKLDDLKSIRSGGKEFVARFEQQIKSETGIKNLKVGFNKVFGYYIEITNSSLKEIKPEFGFERKQTLTGAERFISPLLKEQESIILNAEEKINDLEYKLFLEVKEIIKKELIEIKKTANTLSEIDAITSLAHIADEYKLVRPTFNQDGIIDIKDGKHPVVEIVSNNEYVPNDCLMDKSSQTLLITGPNMSGKSTYMRQLAIIIILAQIGSFVPAKSANLSIIDKIFTRIGASDDLVSGESTFMVEMKEAKNAIANATENSLILFDELGRGTATYDGMAIARAILEYVSEKIKCFTLFSTHYHELTELEIKFSNIKNIHVSAIEENDKLIFLHKIKSGPVDKSYGVHVASLANLPKDLIKRANILLNNYENSTNAKDDNNLQLSMSFNSPKEESDVEKEIKNLDLLNITPIEALNILYKLKDDIKK